MALPPRLARSRGKPHRFVPAWRTACLVLLLLTTPLHAQETPPPPAFPATTINSVLDAGFRAVLERHLELVAPQDLALWTLRGLEALDPSLEASMSGDMLQVRRGDQLLAQHRMPLLPTTEAPGNASAPLATVLTAVLGSVWQAMPAVQRAGPSKILQSGFEELFNHLDPYSRYETPEEALSAQTKRVGQAGLGLRLVAGPRNSVLLAAITPNSPAEQSGIRAGDHLLAIDGEPVAGNDLGDAADRLEGPAGTRVILRLARGRRHFTILLPRSPAPPPPLQADLRDGVLWIHLETFSAVTESAMAGVLDSAFDRATPPRGVVLDLRGNRGGLLTQAVAVANNFLNSGTIVYTGGRHPDARRDYQAMGPDLARGKPIVVVVDGRTASAAEIVAASLSDRGRAVLVGSATLGKGLIQVVMPMPDGGELLVSWARVLAPAGWPVQGLGVLPELCTSLGPQAAQQGFADLTQGIAPMAGPLARLRAARPPVPNSEVIQLRESCPPAEGRDTDLSLAQSLIDTPTAYATALAHYTTATR